MSTEAILQQTFVQMVRILYPDVLLSLSLSGIKLNGSYIENAKTIKALVPQGFERGLPDLTIYLPEGKVLNLEFKRPNGGVQSEDQKKVEAKLLALGHNYHLVRSVEHIFELIANNTLPDFRYKQFDNLSIPSDGNTLTDKFLYWPKCTMLSEVHSKLKELYQIV